MKCDKIESFSNINLTKILKSNSRLFFSIATTLGTNQSSSFPNSTTHLFHIDNLTFGNKNVSKALLRKNRFLFSPFERSRISDWTFLTHLLSSFLPISPIFFRKPSPCGLMKTSIYHNLHARPSYFCLTAPRLSAVESGFQHGFVIF